MARQDDAGLATCTCRFLSTVISYVLMSLFISPALVLLYWFLVAGTRRWRLDEYWRNFPPDFHCNDHVLVDQCEAEKIVYLWFLTFSASLMGLVLVTYAGACHRTGEPRTRIWSAGKFLDLQLYPAKFWAWWCGGFSVKDALLVGLWICINCVWFFYSERRYLQLVPEFKGLGIPVWSLEVSVTAVAFGNLLFPNLVLLFYPVARGSVLLQASGLSYPEAIRYHRWLGHATMYFVTLHSLGFWVTWLIRGVWLKEALDQGSRVNNLLGGVSFLCGLALWLTSLNAVKRRSYDLFYKVHHLGFWGFMLCGCMHFWSMFWYFLPGLLLYAVDAVYRVVQAISPVKQLVKVKSMKGGKVCSIVVDAAPYGLASSGFVWINCPQVCRSQWHPFEYIAVPGKVNTEDVPRSNKSQMLLTIKSYDQWTQAFMAQIDKEGVQTYLKMEGPYPELPPSMHQDDRIIIVAGGIGITAALSLFQDLPHPTHLPLLLIWTCRHPSEVLHLAPLVLGKVRQLRMKAQLKVYYSGDEQLLRSYLAHTGEVQGLPSSTSAMSDVEESPVPRAPQPTYSLVWKPQGPYPPAPDSITPLCPVLAVGGLVAQGAQKMAVHVAVFAGALAAILVLRGNTLVWAADPDSWTTAWLGFSHVVGITLVGVGSGMVVLALVFVVGIVARWRQCKRRDLYRGGRLEPAGSGHLEPLLREEGVNDPRQDTLISDKVEGAPGQTDECPVPAAADSTAVVDCVSTSKMKDVGAMNEGCPDIMVSDKDEVHTSPRASGPQVDICTDSARFVAEVQSLGGLELYPEEESVPVHLGRPAVNHLVQVWLNMFDQLPWVCSGEQPVVGVYGMGPEGLVQDVKVMCDAWNKRNLRGGHGKGHKAAWLRYEQRTHEL